MQHLTVALLVVAALVADAAFYLLRCAASPPVSFNTLALTVVVQGVAALLAYWGTTDAPERASQLFRRPILWLGLWLLLVSLPLARYSLNYSDAIGRPNWFKSVGHQCRAA
jgi:hypothetical protein